METTYQILMLLFWATMTGVSVSQHKQPSTPERPNGAYGLGLIFALLMFAGHITMWQPGGEPATQMPLLNPMELSINAICWLIVFAAVTSSLIATVVIAIKRPKNEGKIQTTRSTVKNLVWGIVVCTALSIAIIN